MRTGAPVRTEVAGGVPERCGHYRAGRHGEPVRDAHFLLLFNAHSDAVEFVLPGADHADGWHVVVDAALPSLRVPA